MVDGVNLAKVPLALEEGDTENATVVKQLLVGLRERGLNVTRKTLFVIDGSKGAQSEKRPSASVGQQVGSIVEKRMRAAYRNPDPLVGHAQMEALATELERSHPGAAASLREGLAETFAVARLGVPPMLARTVR